MVQCRDGRHFTTPPLPSPLSPPNSSIISSSLVLLNDWTYPKRQWIPQNGCSTINQSIVRSKEEKKKDRGKGRRIELIIRTAPHSVQYSTTVYRYIRLPARASSTVIPEDGRKGGLGSEDGWACAYVLHVRQTNKQAGRKVGR